MIKLIQLLRVKREKMQLYLHRLSNKAKNLTCIIFTRVKPETLSTKAEQLEWRRAKVIELKARGMTHVETAHELQVSKQSISSAKLFSK